MWCAVNFATACARLSVIFIDVHYGRFGAFPHQVSPHTRNVLKTVSWKIQFHTLLTTEKQSCEQRNKIMFRFH